MQTAQLNQTTAEKVLLLVKNVDGGGSITTGLGAAFPLAAANASIDGISTVKITAALWPGFAGIAIQDIAINAFGLVQAYGLVSSIQISAVGTSLTVTAGDQLKAGAVAGTFFSSVAPETTSTQYYKYLHVGGTLAISANPVWVTGIVRAL